MTRAWSLLVVSSDAQAETLQHQRAWAQQAAKEKKWVLDREFAGVSSGRDGPRKLLRELIGALRTAEPKPDWVLMIRADRVGRGRIAESQVALHEMIDLGVRIWTREGELKLDTAMDQLISAVRSATAAFENEVKRDKMNAVFRRRKATGQVVGNRVIYGFERTPDGKAKVVKDQAATVKEVYRLRIAGYSNVEIGKRIKPIAAPFRFADGTERTMRWNEAHIREILDDRRYVGPIVDEMTFRRAAKIGGTFERRPQRFFYALSGAVQCSCGYMMVGSFGGGKERPVLRYQCHAKHGQFNAKRLEAQFVDLLKRLAAKPELIDKARKRARVGPSSSLLERAHKETTAKLVAIDKQRERVWDLFAQGKVREDAVQPQLDRIDEKRQAVLDQIAEIETQRAGLAAESGKSAEVAAQLRRAARTFANAAPEDQRAIAKATAALLGGLVVEEDGSLAMRRVERQHLGRKPRKPAVGTG